MKTILVSIFIAATMATGAAGAATITAGTNADYSFSLRNVDWAENIESESGQVAKVGSFSNYNVDAGATPWGSGTWLFSGYVEMTFSVPADTLVVQFQSDSNDGIAEFVVDGVSIGTYNTFNGGWFPVFITGLTNTTHTLRVNRVSADLAFDNFGAISSVPLPAGLPLLLSGLTAMAALCRRKVTVS